MLVIQRVISPKNTADGRIVLHFSEHPEGAETGTLADAQTYELSMTRDAAQGAVLSILFAIGNLPGPIVEREEALIPVSGHAEVMVPVSGLGGPSLAVHLNGVGVYLKPTRADLARLQAEISAVLAPQAQDAPATAATTSA